MASSGDSSNKSAKEKLKFIIDCDCGVDDAVAILMMLQAKEICSEIDLLAITCIGGNCPVDVAVQNVLRTLKVSQQSVPVYRGCSKPLTVGSSLHASIHSNDGLGGVAHNFEPCPNSFQPDHAVTKLIQIVNEHPGEITVVALGPLTNLAMAYRLDESFSSKLKKLVVMGGNTGGKGNVQLAAEFNFHVDPESARIVVEETVCPLQICGWELCGLDNSFSWEWFDKWLAEPTNVRGHFMKSMLKAFTKYRREHFHGAGFSLCDPFAISVALHPDIVLKSTHKKVTVETAGHSTRGMLVIEWRDGQHPRDTKPAELILEVDKEKHKSLLESLTQDA